MKYLFFIILLVAVVLSAGCVNINKKPPGTPASPTVQTFSDEPIVGNWQWTTNDVTKIYKFYFFPDARFSYTDPIHNFTLSGTWYTLRDNGYNVTLQDGKTLTFVYDPTTDTFTLPEFSQVLAYRLGKEPVAAIPPPAPTTIVTTTVPITIPPPVPTTIPPPVPITIPTTVSITIPTPVPITIPTTIPPPIGTNAPREPIVGVWKLSFPDTTYSLDTYNQDGTYRIVSYGFDQQPTGEVLLGTWRKSSTNHYETADNRSVGKTESPYPLIYHADTDTMMRDFGGSIGIITYYRNNTVP